MAAINTGTTHMQISIRQVEEKKDNSIQGRIANLVSTEQLPSTMMKTGATLAAIGGGLASTGVGVVAAPVFIAAGAAVGIVGAAMKCYQSIVGSEEEQSPSLVIDITQQTQVEEASGIELSVASESKKED